MKPTKKKKEKTENINKINYLFTKLYNIRDHNTFAVCINKNDYSKLKLFISEDLIKEAKMFFYLLQFQNYDIQFNLSKKKLLLRYLDTIFKFIDKNYTINMDIILKHLKDIVDFIPQIEDVNN